MSVTQRRNKCRAQSPATCRCPDRVFTPPTVAPKPSDPSSVVSVDQILSGNHSSARQKHGYVYESHLVDRLGLVPTAHATNAWDAFSRSGVPVSIKTKKIGGAVELGSWKLRASNSADFYFLVGFWGDASKQVVDERFMKIPGEFWQHQFPEFYHQKIDELFQGVSNHPDYDAEWDARRKAFQEEYLMYRRKSGSIIRMNPKRDHKTQLRMQCSIDYNTVMSLYNKYGIDESEII